MVVWYLLNIVEVSFLAPDRPFPFVSSAHYFFFFFFLLNHFTPRLPNTKQMTLSIYFHSTSSTLLRYHLIFVSLYEYFFSLHLKNMYNPDFYLQKKRKKCECAPMIVYLIVLFVYVRFMANETPFNSQMTPIFTNQHG